MPIMQYPNGSFNGIIKYINNSEIDNSTEPTVMDELCSTNSRFFIPLCLQLRHIYNTKA